MKTELQSNGIGNPTKNRGTDRQVGARAAWQAAACLLALASSLHFAQAATYVCGGVSGHWTTNGSPYILTCDVQVFNLFIDPGVVVSASNYTFEVDGILTATGTVDMPIVFKAQDLATGWQGIFFNYSGPGSEMRYCIVSNAVNSGVRIADSLPYFEHCTIANNTSASYYGGGIYADIPTQGNLVLCDCTIQNNTSRYSGGGIYVNSYTNTLILECCTFQSNTANPSAYGGTYMGGGLRVFGGLRMRSCLLADNEVRGGLRGWSAEGAGVYAEGQTEVNNCIFRGNYAAAADQDGYAYGGGMTAAGAGPLTLVNSVFSTNISSGYRGSYGGGLYIGCSVTTPRVINCTFAYNNIEGLYVCPDNTVVMNSILFFNSSGGTQIIGTTNVTYCDVQLGGFLGEGNIQGNPGFYPDLIINSYSPCVDAGNTNTAYNDCCFPPSLGSERNDMGAQGGPGACARLHIRANPQVEVAFIGGVPNYNFSGTNYLIQASTNLLGDWQTVQAVSIAHDHLGDVVYFREPSTNALPRRFYKLNMAP
jgi:hypothetical protein